MISESIEKLSICQKQIEKNVIHWRRWTYYSIPSVYAKLKILDFKGAQAWPSRVQIFLHKSDPYGQVT
jgi:hypothetical protein